MPEIDISKIPSELRNLPQWVVWKAKPQENGKIDKPLYDPKSGNSASHSNPENWASFEAALSAYETGGYSGIGFVFSKDDPYCGIDLDSKPEKNIECRNPRTGKIEPWALEIIKSFKSYAEVSPSGSGIHIIVKGQLPEGGRKKPNIEIYNKHRYFTVTGNHLEGTPQDITFSQDAINSLLASHFPKQVPKPSIKRNASPRASLDDEALIQKAIESANGNKFNLLYQGQWEEAGYPSQSEADQALCNQLAFWTGADAGRMDCIFRQSGLIRAKWDENHYNDGRTYGEVTISKAIASCSATYSGQIPLDESEGCSDIDEAVEDLSPKKQTSPVRESSAPSMADLREYVDVCVVPGQKIKVDEICRGLDCFKREERKIVYKNINRLCSEGILKKDDYQHGGYRRVIEVESYDLGGAISEDELNFNIVLPLELHNLIDLKADQLLQVSGRYDAGKSSFLFQIMADNYLNNKITLIVSDEWSKNAIKERMDVLGIPRPHPNITVIPMKPGYEDMIPTGRCICLIDYIRADQNPFETDAQIQRILKNLSGGVAIFATQKHPGLDRPVGGQFAIHASHHVVLLDKWKELFTCKIYRTKKEKNLEGMYKTFKISDQKRLYPVMENWKQGGIKWDNEPKINDGNDGVINAVNRGGPLINKERKKERSKEKKKEREITPVNSGDDNTDALFAVDTLLNIQEKQKDFKSQGVCRNDKHQDQKTITLW